MSAMMNLRRTTSGLTIGAVLTLSLAAVAGAPPRYFKMKSVQVIDKGGFAKPIPAMDLLVPSDWSFDGGVQWGNRGCFADFAAVSFKTTSPDGKIVIEAFPSFSWQAVDNPAVQRYLVSENRDGLKVGLKPCPVFGPVPAADVLRKRVIPQLRPGKEIAAMETSADLDQAVKTRVAALQAQQSKSGQPVQVRADAARARLKYDLDGAPVEEWIIGVSMAQASPSGDGHGGHRLDCRAIMLMSLRAPAGQLEANEKLFDAVRGSIRVEPDWQSQYLSIVSQLSAAQNKQRAIRDQIRANFAQDEIAAINGVTANSQAGSNQAVAGESQILRGVETYRDPNTGKQYELDSKYGNAWKGDGNQVILSEDPNLNPSSVASGSWTPMEHVQAQP